MKNFKDCPYKKSIVFLRECVNCEFFKNEQCEWPESDITLEEAKQSNKEKRL